jgi:hypothetical protein
MEGKESREKARRREERRREGEKERREGERGTNYCSPSNTDTRDT